MSDIAEIKTVKELLWAALISSCNYDIQTIEAVLKTIDRKNLSRYRGKYKPLLNKILSQKMSESGFDKILLEIENQLAS